MDLSQVSLLGREIPTEFAAPSGISLPDNVNHTLIGDLAHPYSRHSKAMGLHFRFDRFRPI